MSNTEEQSNQTLDAVNTLRQEVASLRQDLTQQHMDIKALIAMFREVQKATEEMFSPDKLMEMASGFLGGHLLG